MLASVGNPHYSDCRAAPGEAAAISSFDPLPVAARISPSMYARREPSTCLVEMRESWSGLPYTTTAVYGISHTPGPISHGRRLHSISSWNSVRAKMVGVGNISSRAFRRRVVRYRHPLGFRAIDLRGCVIYSVVYSNKARLGSWVSGH